MNTNNGKTEIPYASWDLEANMSQGEIDEMNMIRELAYQQGARVAL